MDTSGNIRNIATEIPEKDWNKAIDNLRSRADDLDVFKSNLQSLDDLGENEIPLKSEEAKKLKSMSKPRRKNWMRNQPCPCGSGKKTKKCCWTKMAKISFMKGTN
ncbi:MAG: SEC-C domain-containing protein [Planctomycetes bacterium]|nr:SEC-C domain-containing protein [Planctomycetota bacterium]